MAGYIAMWLQPLVSLTVRHLYFATIKESCTDNSQGNISHTSPSTVPTVPNPLTSLAATPTASLPSPGGAQTSASSDLIVKHATSSSDSVILASGSVSIEALHRADGLREVISQVERGEVNRIRELYGPKPGRSTNPMWAQIKGTITRRERLGVEFETEFGGDKERFFSFFTTPVKPGGKKRKATESATEELRPSRLVVQAIPHCNKALDTEKNSEEYQENGAFSEHLWATKWDGKNKWEIWRSIGKEKY
ncbi:hypothetical protein C8R47DRAFT_1079631 [Mycena vitilis]|nr:hypothetical protein C8R47DRAFT_1079631 [Mycena vitilis]